MTVSVRLTSVLTMSTLLVSENEMSELVMDEVPERLLNSIPLSLAALPAWVIVLLASVKLLTLRPVMPLSAVALILMLSNAAPVTPLM